MSENLSNKSNEVILLKKNIKTLNEKYSELENDYDNKVNSLTEQLETIKKDSEIKHSEYSNKLSKSNQLVEKYRNIAKNAVDKYIQLKAQMIGVSSNEIKNKLSENYTFSDIDLICEDLKSYQINISKLPVGITKQSIKNSGIKVTKPTSHNPEYDADIVDKQLLQLAGLD